MPTNVVLRSRKDRLRYTTTFEALLMAILIPVGSLFFDKAMTDIGLLGVVLSTKAMLLNLIYNWAFDRIDARAGRIASERSHIGRILHAIGFEFSLTATSLPILVWWLEIGLLEAFATDVVVTSFVVAYTYVFTLIYDNAFPLTGPANIVET